MKINALEDKSVDCENQLSDHLANIEALRMNMNLKNSQFKMMKESIEEHEKKIEELMGKANDMPVISGDGGVDPNALKKLFADKGQFEICQGKVNMLDK